MQVERQIPLPTREDVQSFLPSEQFPSDHLSVSVLRTFYCVVFPLFRNLPSECIGCFPQKPPAQDVASGLAAHLGASMCRWCLIFPGGSPSLASRPAALQLQCLQQRRQMHCRHMVSSCRRA